MKLTTATLFLSALSLAAAQESALDASAPETTGVTGDQVNGLDSEYTSDIVYDGTCDEQAKCLGLEVVEVERRCGSGSCEYSVCYSTMAGQVSTKTYYDSLLFYSGAGNTMAESVDLSRQETIESCKTHPDYGVDYAGNMNQESWHKDEGGCPNPENSNGKGYWDETCIDPEASDGLTVGEDQDSLFQKYCQIAYPGQTVHFMMHSYYRLDWNGDNAAAVSCSGSSSISPSDSSRTFGSSTCRPSSSEATSNVGQTYFPADDGSAGGTCSDEPEGEECVWSWTAPNYCEYQENGPTCYLTADSVATVDNLCGEEAGPVVEYFEHESNPNEAPPRVPLHDIEHNGDGTVSFKVYNPYGNYVEPITYPEIADKTFEDDFHNMYVVFDEANEIGNEVCEFQPASGHCATDQEYTAKCRSDGIAIVTIFASGFDDDSGAAQAITNDEGTDVFECCPASYDPLENFNKEQTAAWTYLIHCDCPEEEEEAARRRLRSDDSVSSKFQKGELFTENQKKLHNLL